LQAAFADINIAKDSSVYYWLGSMPIVTVEVVTGADEAMAQNIAQSLADAIGGALKSPPGQTWVRVRSIARDQYAENGVSLDPAELPVFVTILKLQASQRAELEHEVAALASAVAQTVGRPATCVHIEYAPAAAGRLAFGGVLIQ
jgi:phenylpyruvate tautomerase PptA (4-oxalocrotonate tautomerase family)